MKNFDSQYADLAHKLTRLDSEVLRQIDTILKEADVTLANPMEHRVKSLESLVEKIQRKSISADKALIELPDLVGFRVVLLFRRDLERIHSLVQSAFNVVEVEDTSSRLSEGQFGYQSHHYVCRIPDDWAALPSLKGLK